MTISKQLPLLQKTNAYAWRGIGSITSGFGASIQTVPVCTNGYFELSTESLEKSRKFAYCKRPGVQDWGITITTNPNLQLLNASENIKGLCVSLDKTKILFETQDGSNRYSYHYDSTTDTLSSPTTLTSFPAEFYAMTTLDGVNYGPDVYYAAMSVETGIGALIDSAGVWTKITDADFTGNGVKTNFVGLDGYLFYGVISGTGAGRIYNSDLSTAAPTTGWSSNYISANDIPGNIVWLSRIRNMIVCFKQYSIEFFEDTGNPTPGSPLTPRRNLLKNIGCASASTIQEVSDGIIFAGIDTQGKIRYYKLQRDSLEVKPISDSLLEALCNNGQDSIAGFRSWSCDWEVTSATSTTFRGQSQVINFQNKELYTTVVPSAKTDTPMTYVYDNQIGTWGTWNTGKISQTGTSDGTFIPAMSFGLNIAGSSYTTCFVNNRAELKDASAPARFCVMVPFSLFSSYRDYVEYTEVALLTGFLSNATGATWTLTTTTTGDGFGHKVSIRNDSATDYSATGSALTATLTGTDVNDDPLIEVVSLPNAGSTVWSVGNFKTLTTVVPSATINADTMDIGWGSAEDTGFKFAFAWQSDFFDFETSDRKFLHLIEIMYDSDPGITIGAETDFTLKLSHFNQDYLNTIASNRTCTIDNAGNKRAVFRKLGNFRRKAFQILDVSDYPLRIWGIEVVYSGGPQYA